MQYADNVGPNQHAISCSLIWTSLFIDINCSIHWFCKWITKVQLSLCERTGWSGPALSADYRRIRFARWESYASSDICKWTSRSLVTLSERQANMSLSCLHMTEPLFLLRTCIAHAWIRRLICLRWVHFITSREHACIILTPLNPTFIQ